MKDENSAFPDNWKHGTSQSVKVLMFLDLVETIARNMKNENEGVLKIHMDFKVV